MTLKSVYPTQHGIRTTAVISTRKLQFRPSIIFASFLLNSSELSQGITAVLKGPVRKTQTVLLKKTAAHIRPLLSLI